MKNILLHPALPKVRRPLYRFLGLVSDALGMQSTPSIFCYHGIGNDQWRFGVSFEDFVQQITWLQKNGYTSCTLTEVLAHMHKGSKLPEKSFVVTFDDGYQDTLLVKDFLLERGIRPTLFVLSDPDHVKRDEIETGRQFLSVDEIRELHAAGWEIGCHSATHADFASLDISEMKREIADAKQELEKNLGITIRYFAYPKGYHDERVRVATKEAGYEAAFSMDDGFIKAGMDRFAIPRVGIDRTHRIEEFKVIAKPTSILFRRSVKRALAAFDRLRALLKRKESFRLSEQS